MVPLHPLARGPAGRYGVTYTDAMKCGKAVAKRPHKPLSLQNNPRWPYLAEGVSYRGFAQHFETTQFFTVARAATRQTHMESNLESTALLPQLDAVGNEPKPDWTKIEAEFRAGVRSLRDIAREFGVSQPAISKYAQRHGWTRAAEVITAADNPPDNQGDNRKLSPEEAMRVFDAGMRAAKADPILAEPAWAGRPDDGFWESEDARECIVANRQHAVAVYTNSSDQLVIRQERDWDQDEDTFVIVDRTNAAALVKRIYELMGWKLQATG